MTTPTPNKDASKAKDASIFQGIEDTIERNRRSASPSPSEPSQEVSEPSNSKPPTLPNPTQTPTQDKSAPKDDSDETQVPRNLVDKMASCIKRLRALTDVDFEKYEREGGSKKTLEILLEMQGYLDLVLEGEDQEK